MNKKERIEKSYCDKCAKSVDLTNTDKASAFETPEPNSNNQLNVSSNIISDISQIQNVDISADTNFNLADLDLSFLVDLNFESSIDDLVNDRGLISDIICTYQDIHNKENISPADNIQNTGIINTLYRSPFSDKTNFY